MKVRSDPSAWIVYRREVEVPTLGDLVQDPAGTWRPVRFRCQLGGSRVGHLPFRGAVTPDREDVASGVVGVVVAAEGDPSVLPVAVPWAGAAAIRTVDPVRTAVAMARSSFMDCRVSGVRRDRTRQGKSCP
jgi:hypothetical protein